MIPERANELATCWVEKVLPDFLRSCPFSEDMFPFLRVALSEAFKAGMLIGMIHHDHEGIVKPERLEKH